MEVILLLVLGMIIGFIIAVVLVARWGINLLNDVFRNL